MRQAREAIARMFRSDLYQLVCVDMVMSFDESRMPQRQRPAVQHGLLCISKETAPDGSLLSVFSAGHLFVRQTLVAATMPLQTSEYVNPLATNLDFRIGARSLGNVHLSEEAQLKQWISGENLYRQAGGWGAFWVSVVVGLGKWGLDVDPNRPSQVLRSLLKNVVTNATNSVAVIDLIPYDASLPLMCLSGLGEVGPDDSEDQGVTGLTGVTGVSGVRGSRPDVPFVKHFACFSVLCFGKEEDRAETKTFIQKRVVEAARLAVRCGRSMLPGAEDIPAVRSLQSFTAQPGTCQQLDESKFKHTKPLADFTLPVLQKSYDEFEDADQHLKASFAELIDKHDKEFNPSGRPWKDHTRPRGEDDSTEVEGEAVTLTGQPDVPQTKALLMETYPDAQILPGATSDFEYICVKGGELFVHGLKDSVVPTTTHLIGSGPGVYDLAKKAATTREGDKYWWIEYDISDADQLGLFTSDMLFPSASVPTKLSDFLLWLEKEGEINLRIANNTLTRTEEEGGKVSFAIAPEGPAVFRLTTTFPRTRGGRPNQSNAGAFIHFASSKQSAHVKWIQHFQPAA